MIQRENTEITFDKNNKITELRSRPLSMHQCRVRHLYHSWC